MKRQVRKEQNTSDCTSNDSIVSVAGVGSDGRVIWSS